jgi:monoamine oxidase
MDQDELNRVTVAEMERVHPGLSEQLECVVAKCWDNDRWQRGAFTLYRSGEHSLFAPACRSEGSILFAGEHASAWPGWMQGALLSGMRAAREVNGLRGDGCCGLAGSAQRAG